MALFCLLQTVLFDEELLKALEQVVRQQGWEWGRGWEAGKGVEFGPVPGCSENVHRLDSLGWLWDNLKLSFTISF